jgi:hypothetical protein
MIHTLIREIPTLILELISCLLASDPLCHPIFGRTPILGVLGYNYPSYIRILWYLGPMESLAAAQECQGQAAGSRNGSVPGLLWSGCNGNGEGKNLVIGMTLDSTLLNWWLLHQSI